MSTMFTHTVFILLYQIIIPIKTILLCGIPTGMSLARENMRDGVSKLHELQFSNLIIRIHLHIATCSAKYIM